MVSAPSMTENAFKEDSGTYFGALVSGFSNKRMANRELTAGTSTHPNQPLAELGKMAPYGGRTILRAGAEASLDGRQVFPLLR